MNVIQYQEKYKKDFIQFNTDWIVDNFGCLEEEDLETFNHIEENLKNGAMIYFAVDIWKCFSNVHGKTPYG